MVSNEDIQKKQQNKIRSRIYPRYSLESAIEFLRVIDHLGGINVSQQTVLDELKKTSLSDAVFTGKISSARQFGLLEGTKTYSVTDTGRLILYPVPGSNMKQLLSEGFTKPPLYQHLVERFNGKSLPEKSSLGNILLNEYGIAKNAKNHAAGVFIKSATFADVLKNGLLLIDGTNSSKETTGEVLGSIPTFHEEVGFQTVNIKLSKGKAKILVPDEISDDDKVKLKKQIDLF